MPSMLFCVTKDRCTYWRTAGGHSIFFAAAAVGAAFADGFEGAAVAVVVAVVVAPDAVDFEADFGRDAEAGEVVLLAFERARRA